MKHRVIVRSRTTEMNFFVDTQELRLAMAVQNIVTHVHYENGADLHGQIVHMPALCGIASGRVDRFLAEEAA